MPGIFLAQLQYCSCPRALHRRQASPAYAAIGRPGEWVAFSWTACNVVLSCLSGAAQRCAEVCHCASALHQRGRLCSGQCILLYTCWQLLHVTIRRQTSFVCKHASILASQPDSQPQIWQSHIPARLCASPPGFGTAAVPAAALTSALAGVACSIVCCTAGFAWRRSRTGVSD